MVAARSRGDYLYYRSAVGNTRNGRRYDRRHDREHHRLPRVDVKGQVFGVVVRSRGLGGNIMAGLRSIVGGEITEYTQLLEEARRHAVDRMVSNAHLMRANAVVMMRFDSAEIGPDHE